MSEKKVAPPGPPPGTSEGDDGGGASGGCDNSIDFSSHSYDSFDIDQHGKVVVVRKRMVSFSNKSKLASGTSSRRVVLPPGLTEEDIETADEYEEQVGGARLRDNNNSKNDSNNESNGGSSISKILTAGCKFICCVQMTPQRLLKSAFSIRAFRGSEIRKVSTKVEMLLKVRFLLVNAVR